VRETTKCELTWAAGFWNQLIALAQLLSVSWKTM